MGRRCIQEARPARRVIYRGCIKAERQVSLLPDPTMQGSEKHCVSSGKEPTPDSQRAFSYCEPTGGKPDLSCTDGGILAGRAKGTVVADCDKQLFPVGRVVSYWSARPRLFWDFATSGTSRRRTDRNLYGMGDAEAARGGRTQRSAQKCTTTGCTPPSFLPINATADSRSRINFGGDHPGRECLAPLWNRSLGHYGCAYRISSDCIQHFPMLWVCGPAGANPGSDGNERDHAAVIVSAGLHRCADCMEWS